MNKPDLPDGGHSKKSPEKAAHTPMMEQYLY
jgi:hypothetical protein